MTATAVEPAPHLVRGQHRNKALAAWRRARAVELAVEGHTYEEIARGVGYANRGTAYRVVQQALGNRVDEGVHELRRLEQDRLDALQAGLWKRALAGDPASVRAALRILESRCRLLGLYEPSAHRGSLAVGTCATTVVRGADPRVPAVHEAGVNHARRKRDEDAGPAQAGERLVGARR